MVSGPNPERLRGVALLAAHEQIIRGVKRATEGLRDINESIRTGRPLREHLGKSPLQLAPASNLTSERPA